MSAKVVPDDGGGTDKPFHLTSAQIDVAIDPQKRRYATMAIIVAAFVDIGCSVILQPSHPMMCSNAPKAVRPSEWPEGYSHPQAFPGDEIPEYQWAVSLLLVFNQLGQSISQICFGVLSDKIGRRPCMLICIFMSSVTMTCYYLSGVVLESYWAYAASQAVNGLFGAMKGLGSTYIQDINSPEDFKAIQPVIITAFTFGGVAGGLVGGVVNGAARVDDYSGDLFVASLVGVCGSLTCFFAVFFFCPEPPKKVKSDAKASTNSDPSDKTKPTLDSRVRKVLLVLVIAGGFDAFGDNGNTFARNVIFSNRYPLGKEPTWNTILICLKCVGVFIAMMMVVKSAKFIRMPIWTIIGNLFSGGCQYGIIPNSLPMGGFVAIWTVSQCFGFTSTMANIFLLPAFAPSSQRGFWIGLNNAVLMFCMAAAPVTLSLVYTLLLPEEGSPISEYADAELACLLTCGSISLFAALLYAQLIWLIPKPPPPAPWTPSQEELEKYLLLSSKEYSRAPGPMRYAINKMLMEQGRDPIHAHWVPYAEDFEDGELTRIIQRSESDFKFLEDALRKKVADRERLSKDHKQNAAFREMLNGGHDVAEERIAMGSWIADYLNDAGYHSWLWFPDTYKAMIMNAFPPIDTLDNKIGTFEDVDRYEQYLVNFAGIMKRHTSMSQREETTESMKYMAGKTV